MNNKSRTKKAYFNSVIALFTQLIQIFLGFVIRKIFITYLGVNYLGYNSVFLNILQMLNLADMGIGVAITSYLYKPLAENDKKRINALMKIYKRLYSIIGVLVLIMGIIVSMFLGKIIPDAPDGIAYLRILFYINLLGTVSTYFLAYKRTLLIADQKSYMTNVVDTIIYFIITITQLFLLIAIPNYIIYISLNIAKNIISNIIISIKVNKNYKYLDESVDEELIKEYKPQIFQYVKDVFVSRIGAVVYYSTDNIILSVIKGSILTGYLSNYTLITGQLNTIVSQVLSSLQSTFGNYINTTKDKIAKMKMTDNYFCINFCVGNFCMICFSILANSFVELFFGMDMLLPLSTSTWLGINMMLTFLIQLPSQVFVIYKLFKYDKPIIIVSAILNIVISVVLVKIIGLNGALIGTFITSLIYLFSRFYIIAKYVYEINYSHYIKKIIYYLMISLLSFVYILHLTQNITVTSIWWFGIKGIIICINSVFCTLFFLTFTDEFVFLKNKIIPSKIRVWINKKSILIITIILSIISISLSNINEKDFKATGNKSLIRNDTYLIEEQSGRNIYNISFDDVILLFQDIAENKYESIFSNSTLNYFRELHEKYGVVISCYVFYENEEFRLCDFPDVYKKEFIANSDWLKFGFHGLNCDSNYNNSDTLVKDYEKVINELERIVGEESIDNVIRLSYFSGNENEIKSLVELSKEKCIGLFTADDNRKSYYLSEEENSYIYSHDEYYDVNMDLYFISTDIRLEYIEDVNKKIKEFSNDSWNNQLGDLTVFSHEWSLNNDNKNKLDKLCQFAKDSAYQNIFFEDILK